MNELLSARRAIATLSLAWLLTIGSILRAAGLPEEAGCLLLTKEGKVDVARAGTLEWRSAETNQVLHAGDRLRTGLRSRATLQWSGLSVLRVNELTSLELQPPSRNDKPPQLELRSGASYFFSRERPQEIEFRTPIASGAIRGTEFLLAVDDDGRTVLSLFEGVVDLTGAQQTEVVQRGEQGTVEPGRAPVKTALLNARAVMQWVLHYPGVVDPEDIGLSANESARYREALELYRAGDLLGALAQVPADRQPDSDAERVLRAALLLGAGQAAAAQADLRALSGDSGPARALRVRVWLPGAHSR